MLYEQISGYLHIKEKLIVWAETLFLLSSSCSVEGTARGGIAIQGWRDSGSCPGRFKRLHTSEQALGDQERPLKSMCISSQFHAK